MSRTLSRVAGGALAILMIAAAGNVAIASAQTTGGVAAISTDCGSGTIQQCATQKTYKCEWTIELSWIPMTYLPIISFSEECVESGTRPIYKDRYPSTTTSKTCVGADGIEYRCE